MPQTQISTNSAPAINHRSASSGLLRCVACGSVDDGKSTLIGRLLYETRSIPDDELAMLRRDSRRHGTVGDEIDFALAVDGLEAEREQNSTIDVAYRFFSTLNRSFILIDAPGHEQYTRNMAKGASDADAAVVLVDIRNGIVSQTRRHSHICALMGIRHVVVVVNKMDLVGFAQERFERVREDYGAFARSLDFASIAAIPVSARFGDNVTAPSPRTAWYSGQPLLEYLESIDTERTLEARPFRLPVQWVNRPNPDFRGFSGSVASGTIARGDRVVVAASGQQSSITRIVTAEGDLSVARAGAAITVTLADNIDVARGDVLACATNRPQVADQFAAYIIWMSSTPLLPERSYLMRAGTRFVPAHVSAIKHKIDVNTFAELAARTLTLNDIGLCNVATASPVAFDAYADSRATGSFVLIDRETNETAGAGMILFPLRRATNIHRQNVFVHKASRVALNGHKPAILWFTGLSGAGKSLIANLVEQELHSRGVRTYLLDGDNVRHALNQDLGFTDADRVENVRRVGEVAKLFVDAGIVVLCAFISRFRAQRKMVRDGVEPDEFVEIYIDTPLDECARRDVKGLYAQAREGRLRNVTGIDSPYEVPESPELVLPGTEPAKNLATRVLELLTMRGIVS